MSDAIFAQRDGAIAAVVLNKPQKLNALEIFPEGRVFDAIEAKEKTLVGRVVADARVEAEARAAAARITACAPLIACWHKKLKFARPKAPPERRPAPCR